MAGPTRGLTTAGNILAIGTTLAAGASRTDTVDFSSATFGGNFTVTSTGGGTVAATNGCKVEYFLAADTTPNFDTVAAFAAVIPTVVSTTARRTFKVGTDKVQVKLTNLDATNAITVGITAAPES